MNLLLGVFVAMATIGCATGPTAYEQYDAGMTRAFSAAEQNLVAPDCSKIEIPVEIEPQTKFYAAKCGRITNLSAVKAEICPALKLTGKACSDQAIKTMVARLVERYPLVTNAQLTHACNLDPVKCETLLKTEDVMAELHNKKVQALYKIAIDNLGEQRVRRIAQEDEDRSNSIANALSGFAAGFNGTANNSSPQPASTYRSTYCSGIKPLAGLNCRVACINGSWSQVCN